MTHYINNLHIIQNLLHIRQNVDFPGGVNSKKKKKKNLLVNAGDIRVQPLGWEDPLEEGIGPTPVFLPGESHGQRSLADYSPWGHKELDTNEEAWHTRIHAKH